VGEENEWTSHVIRIDEEVWKIVAARKGEMELERVGRVSMSDALRDLLDYYRDLEEET
jgi:hypothetical protein